MGKTNEKSIVAIIMGILAIVVPYIGIIFGVIGMIFSAKSIKEIEGSNEAGRGLAVSGKICSIAGICIQCLLLLFAILAIAMYYRVETQ
ncbi:DUF4190 domain-containing protein [Heyndrickxia sporothermodurans]